ncbi:MAG: M1 family metallopeptidase [Dermatophilaceae bacterium]
MSIRRRTARLVAASAALSLTTATVAYAAGPGAAGIGDPYYPTYGNGGYDVSHYALDVTYVPATTTVQGRATITATATQDLTSFNLDLLLTASRVTVNGKAATFTKGDRHELVVTPASVLRKGTAMTVEVAYSGRPQGISYGEVSSPWIGGNTEALALGEPEIAAWWYPSNDHPRDKATFDMTFRVPKGLEAIGNGLLVSKATVGSTDVWRWSVRQPMATYLAFMAIGQYSVSRGTSAGRPYVVAINQRGDQTAAGYARRDIMKTPQVINWEATQFGPYAFDRVGGVVPSMDFGYALETQTGPVYTQGFWGGGSNMFVVVHENAHQWFGDSVSVHNWKDIWLNEGFATYAEMLYAEHTGQGTTNQLLKQMYDEYAAGDTYFWGVRLTDPGKHNEFNGAVYERGAMALAALRHRIGAPALTRILKTWTAQKKGGNGTVEEFEALATKISGQNLGGFFQHWLVDRRKPAQTAENGLTGLTSSTRSSSAALGRILANTRMYAARDHAR